MAMISNHCFSFCTVSNELTIMNYIHIENYSVVSLLRITLGARRNTDGSAIFAGAVWWSSQSFAVTTHDVHGESWRQNYTQNTSTPIHRVCESCQWGPKWPHGESMTYMCCLLTPGRTTVHRVYTWQLSVGHVIERHGERHIDSAFNSVAVLPDAHPLRMDNFVCRHRFEHAVGCTQHTVKESEVRAAAERRNAGDNVCICVYETIGGLDGAAHDCVCWVDMQLILLWGKILFTFYLNAVEWNRNGMNIKLQCKFIFAFFWRGSSRSVWFVIWRWATGCRFQAR